MQKIKDTAVSAFLNRIKEKYVLNKIILIFCLIFCFLFYSDRDILAFYDPLIIALDEMHECTIRESNICLDVEQNCIISCTAGGKCLEDCHSKETDCVDNARKIDSKYEECFSEFEKLCFGETFLSDCMQNGYQCKFMKDCLSDYIGLCKMSFLCGENDDGVLNNLEYDDGLEGEIIESVNLPTDSGNTNYSCAGEIPENSTMCNGDDKDVFSYTKKKLVESCSSPEGSDPKCEFTCKTKLLDNDTCKKDGFLKKILNWLKGLASIFS